MVALISGHDATTRIWKIPQSKNSPYEEPIVLKAVFNGENSEPGSQNVVVMDWSVSHINKLFES